MRPRRWRALDFRESALPDPSSHSHHRALMTDGAKARQADLERLKRKKDKEERDRILASLAEVRATAHHRTPATRPRRVRTPSSMFACAAPQDKLERQRKFGQQADIHQQEASTAGARTRATPPTPRHPARRARARATRPPPPPPPHPTPPLSRALQPPHAPRCATRRHRRSRSAPSPARTATRSPPPPRCSTCARGSPSSRASCLRRPPAHPARACSSRTS